MKIDLPRNAAERQEQHIVRVVPTPALGDGPDPVLAVVGDRGDGLVEPGEGDANDLETADI